MKEPLRVHPSAVVEEGAELGPGTAVWHFSHIMPDARIGSRCVVGQGCFIASGVSIGDGCRIQNHVSLFEGVELADDVFVGPSAVFTNVRTPRARFPRKPNFEPTRIGEGATIGANATIVCGIDVGARAFVAAGAVVTRSVPDHAIVAGVPATIIGWTCACAEVVVRGRVRPRTRVCPRCGVGPGTSRVTSGRRRS